MNLIRTFWLLLFSGIFAFAAPNTEPGRSILIYDYDERVQVSIRYDKTSQPAFDYDSGLVPVPAEKENPTAGSVGIFGDFAGFFAAKGTTSLLPARSPWPGNSGFIEGTVERKFLMPGETIDRYGFGGGRFVSPAGTPVGARALRPGTENLPFNTYQVVKPFEVNAGGVQPWFGQPGLGTQYELPVSVNTLLNRGIIQPVP